MVDRSAVDDLAESLAPVSKQRAWQLRKAALGLCVSCGGARDEEGISRCGLCSEIRNRRARMRRLRAKKAAGLV